MQVEMSRDGEEDEAKITRCSITLIGGNKRRADTSPIFRDWQFSFQRYHRCLWGNIIVIESVVRARRQQR